MDPPQCVQNAMMTKDKKPFTYTPGGIDLSEVRSPRMARRIERNANLGGAGEVFKPQPPPPHNVGPLPPSVEAVMRPQPQVQVFPTGPPPPPSMVRGGAPPPPPPPSNVPPPPPPPTGPLPTQKVRTADNQVLERPDMTRIIPDNPMALLRKTSGPQPRKSLIDEMFAQQGKAPPSPGTPPSGYSRPHQYEQELPRYQTPVIERGAPISPVPQQYQPAPSQFQPQEYQPSRQQYQPAPPQQRSPEAVQEPTRYQPPVIERQSTLPRQNNTQPEVKTSTAHLGSLYIPPASAQQPQLQQQKRVSPPTPPERNLDSPNIQTPPLREAPRPWQTKKTQPEEIPSWAKRENQVPVEREEVQVVQQPQIPPTQQQPQQRWPQSKPVQQAQPQYNQQPQYVQQPPYQQQPQYVQQPQYSQQPQYNQQVPAGVPVRIEVRTNTRPTPYQQPPQEQEERKPNAVYITQPVVLQHPGPKTPPQQQQKQQWQQQNVQQQQQRVDNQGARVIPIQVEGANPGPRSPPTPGNERSLNRQQSWGSNPTQSNSFKIIQKITHTDDDEEDENVPLTEHGPKYPQNFQQLPADQLRRMKLNEGDQNLMNKFKQVPRGPQPQSSKGPQVRTIPVQIEGDDAPQPYVHPSEQVVPEPKKYTGSSIPSRSFKILQAMTAPDNCANVDEQYEAHPYEQWGFDPNYVPYPPSPYWHDYYYNYYYQEPPAGLSKEEQSEASSRSMPRQTPTPRQTPVPFWGYMPPYSYPAPRRASTVDGESDAETTTNPRSTPSNARSTPLHFWGYGYPPYSDTEDGKSSEEMQGYPQYPPMPYYDPYYYSYYYGYPPMYPPPYYGMNSDTDDLAGYSSTDEMAYYNKKFTEGNRRRNSLGRSSTPRVMVTPTLNVKEKLITKTSETQEPEVEQYISDSESDTETEQEEQTDINTNTPLKSVRSVNNIHVYADDDTNSQYSEDEVCIEEYSEDGNEDIDEESSLYIVDDEMYPHQLSVIYEESERTDSRMRSASALSDSTTIAEKSDDEAEQPSPVANVNKPFKFCVSVTEENKDEIKTVVTVGDREIKTFEEKEKHALAASEGSSVTPKKEDIKPNEEEEEGKESDESEDWWGIIGKEDDLPPPKPVVLRKIKRGEDAESNTETKEASNAEEIKDVAPNMEENIKENTNNAPIKLEEVAKPNNNYAKAIKSVYDKIEEQFAEDGNSGTLIELESFVAKLEKMQRESGLWNLGIAKKIKNDNEPTNKEKENVHNGKTQVGPNGKMEKEHQVNQSVSYENEMKSKASTASKEVSNAKGSASYNDYNSSKSCQEMKGKSEASVMCQNIPKQVEEVQRVPGKNKHQNNYPENSNKKENKRDHIEESEISSDELDSSSSEDESEDQPKQSEVNSNDEIQMQLRSIKERIEALKENIRQKQSKLQEQETKVPGKEKVSALETTAQTRSKTTSTKSSVKSFEEYSEEEEGDSGVTSDMSRHISDTEEFPELKKLTRYERAATHSRLFKLLQDECENEEDGDDEVRVTVSEADKQSYKEKSSSRDEPPRRDQLSLPLNKAKESESLCSSGVNSPGSPINEKLVNELVQSLLKRKKGQMFRNVPKEKLYAAAARILQEDMELGETPSEDGSSFLSPLRGSTGSSTAAQTPQEFNGNYDEYKQYYESWSDAEGLYDENYDILPSKAFKLLQEHSNLNKTGTIAGLLAKCPRVLSAKNVHKNILKLLESPDCPSPTPENPLESNEVTSAS